MGPPEWAREYLEEADKKKMEKSILDAFYQISLETKEEAEVAEMKEEAQRNKVKVEAEERRVKLESHKKEESSSRNPDSELFWAINSSKKPKWFEISIYLNC